MREALARIDNDFVLSEPKRKGAKPAAASGFLRRPKQAADFAAKYVNLIIGLIFTGLLITVLVNALAWQKTRHPAPLFGHTLPIEAKLEPKLEPKTADARSEAPIPVARPTQQAAPETAAVSEPAANVPHGRDLMAEAAQLSSQRPAVTHDPIAQLLKSPAVESSKTVLAAQRALMKLGYVVKPDGVMRPATRLALEQFEREHSLPAHGNLSPKVLHELSAESGIAIE